MLHNTTREQLLQQNQGDVARVIDAAYFMGMKEYATFTAAEIISLLSPLQISPQTIRKALHSRLFRRSGIRTAIYMLPAPSTVRKAVGGDADNSTRDDLPAEAFHSIRAYRMGLHKALVTRRPGRYLRHLLARRLGVCKNTTRNYDRALKLSPEPSFNYIPLDDAMIEQLPTEPPASRKYFLFVKHPKEPFYARLKKEIALFWRAKGVAVQMMQQTGNFYGAAEHRASYTQGEYSDFINS